MQDPRPHSFLPPSQKKGNTNYDPLPWDQFFDRKVMVKDKIPTYIAGDHGLVFFCLHGAGHSALSFAAFARRMKNEFTVVSFDFRGHGEHTHENEADLSVGTLISDTQEVFDAICELFPKQSVIFVGHSMGGSIATKTVKSLLERDGQDSET